MKLLYVAILLIIPSLISALLTGTYTVSPYHTPTARYYITQTSDTQIFWLGDSNVIGGWRNIGNGNITGNNTLVVNWADPAPGTNTGSVTLTIRNDGTLVVVAGTGFDISAVFTPVKFGVNRGISGYFSVSPYHTASALYYITQEGPTQIRWVGDSRISGSWKNIATGIISGNQVTVTWNNFSPVTSTDNGQVVLNINPDGTFTVASGTGFNIGAVFARPNQVISGVYQVVPYHTPTARYYITVVPPSSIVWLGDSNTGAWRNTATGTIIGNTVTVNWTDPPPGINYGQVVLGINPNRTLTVLSGSGFSVGALFQLLPPAGDLGITGPSDVTPYHTPSARYYITQVTATSVVWLGDSNTGAWRNTGTGTISGNELKINWVDIPPSKNSGQALFYINSDRSLTMVDGTGFNNGAVFAFAVPYWVYPNPSLTGTFSVSPYHTTTARYYITQVTASSVVWLGDSNTGAWRNTATGTITDNTVTVNWADPPPGTNTGQVVLSINKDGSLVVLSGSGFGVGAVFSRVLLAGDRIISGAFSVVPYHTSTALYYISQTSANTLVWLGDSNAGSWRNTAKGTITGNQITVTWTDILPSLNNGQATLNINPDGTLTVVNGTGFTIGSVFAQVGQLISGPYKVVPYHTPSALYYITKVGNKVVWLGDSNTGSFRNTGSGYILKNQVIVTWVDVPPSTNNGKVTLAVNADRTLTVVSGTGFNVGAAFQLLPLPVAVTPTSITGPYQVIPYHTPTARYYITQLSANTFVWLGLSNNLSWRNTGTGIIVGKSVSAVWVDISPSTNNGVANFTYDAGSRTLTVVGGTGFNLNSVFSFYAPGWYSYQTSTVITTADAEPNTIPHHSGLEPEITFFPSWVLPVVISGVVLLVMIAVVLAVVAFVLSYDSDTSGLNVQLIS